MVNNYGEIFGWVFAFPLVVIFLFLVIRMRMAKRQERSFKASLAGAAMEYDLRQIPEPEIPSVTRRVHALLQPPVYGNVGHEKHRPVFSGKVGGRDAFLYYWVYYSPSSEGRDTVEQLACILLCPSAPYLRVTPKGLFGKPANSIEHPEDSAFSKAFWIAGQDKAAVRRYLGPELRQFLLSLDKGWRFHAGPEGVALVRGGLMYPVGGWGWASLNLEGQPYAPWVRAIFGRLATVAEASARR